MVLLISSFFFFNDTATTEIYTLSLHDALPISLKTGRCRSIAARTRPAAASGFAAGTATLEASLANAVPTSYECVRLVGERSEEHTSELQSRLHIVCRLLLAKKKTRSRRPAASS